MNTINHMVMVCGLFTILVGFANAGIVKTIRGEVIDVSNYIKAGIMRTEIKRCVSKCMTASDPAGILELHTGQVYVVVAKNQKMDPSQKVIPYMSEIIDVTGEVNSQGGSRTIAVQDIKEINPSTNDIPSSPARQMEMYGY
jgi:hypothetical protein